MSILNKFVSVLRMCVGTMVTAMYVCEKCGYETETKCNYTRHLGKKIPCRKNDPLVVNGDTDHSTHVKCPLCCKRVTRAYFRKHTLACKGVPTNSCTYCNKQLASRSGKSQHQKICNANPSNMSVQSTFNTSHVTITNNHDNSVDNSVTNVTNNNVVNLTVNFGGEEIGYLLNNDDTRVRSALSCILDAIDLVHFNDDHPENQTVRKLDKKSNMMEIKKNDVWEHESCAVGIPKLRNNLQTHFKKPFDDRVRYTNPNLKELLYHKSKRGNIPEEAILDRYAPRCMSQKCMEECQRVKDTFFKTVSPGIQKMPCVVQDLQRQLNEVRSRFEQNPYELREVIAFVF